MAMVSYANVPLPQTRDTSYVLNTNGFLNQDFTCIVSEICINKQGTNKCLYGAPHLPLSLYSLSLP